jgi:hypothetical protein
MRRSNGDYGTGSDLNRPSPYLRFRMMMTDMMLGVVEREVATDCDVVESQ